MIQAPWIRTIQMDRLSPGWALRHVGDPAQRRAELELLSREDPFHQTWRVTPVPFAVPTEPTVTRKQRPSDPIRANGGQVYSGLELKT